MSFASAAEFETALSRLPAPDGSAIVAAQARQTRLTKPAGSLGRLEELALFFAGWQGKECPSLRRGRTVVFAGNHGVTRHGVSAFPPEVTAQMVANFQVGGAAINALSRAAGLELKVVPLDLERPTIDFADGPAMSEEECLTALSIGASVVDPDLDLLALGEMGIGNTTAAAALCALSFGGGGEEWAGEGTGLDAEGVARKVDIVDQAMVLHRHAPPTPVEIMRRVGGREIAAIAGAVLRARQLRIPVMLDGFICCSALAPLTGTTPAITDHCLAAHCSAEAGHVRLLERLGLDPLLRLGMRLGEASGAAVAVNIVRSALAAHSEMATFAQAGVASAP